ncbi:mitochondrial inner membrane protein OXA1L-like [Oratosquilla oratoria]|uniref:mitochondrial inner membrane protein OXA1L-like n=1 Tax=Oratosquilla oratoria TaxID=337810 RepID=UPI003F7646A5
MAQNVCKHIKLGNIGNYHSTVVRSGQYGWRSKSIYPACQYYKTLASSYPSSCSISQQSRMKPHGRMVMPIGHRFLQLHPQTLVKRAPMCRLQSHNFSTTTSAAAISGLLERLFSVKAAPVTTEEEFGQMPEVTTQVPLQEPVTDFSSQNVTQEAVSEPVSQFGAVEQPAFEGLTFVEDKGTPIMETIDGSEAQIPFETSAAMDVPLDTTVQATPVDMPIMATSTADTPVMTTSIPDTPVMATSTADTPIMTMSSADIPIMTTSTPDTPVMATTTAETPVVESLGVDVPVADIPVADVVSAGASNEIPLVDSIQYIPPPPAPPVEEAAAQVLNALGEPTFASLGLGGWTPVGLVQNWLEFMHVSLDLPWWGTIALATVILRSLLFPLVIVAQRNTAKMNNNMPQLQVLQMKMTEARNMGNHMESARLAQEMSVFLKEKEISPLRSVIVPLAQAPIFISMFLSLRKLSNLPIESMKEGGMLWFTDLTVADPYFALPIITSLTLAATIELGTDGPSMKASNMQMMRYFIRAMPFIIFPFTFSFPTAVLCYWVSTNMFSLVQVGVLKIPTVRQYFNIEMTIKHKPETLPQKKKGFVEGFQESWTNMRITREIEERQQLDEVRFRKAGTGPIVRTYRDDPTKRKNVIDVKPVNKK